MNDSNALPSELDYLIDGCEAGFYTLPKDLRAAHSAFAGLRDADSAEWGPGIRRASEAGLVEEMLAAAGSGKKLPDAAVVAEERLRAEAADVYNRALNEATRQASMTVRRAFRDSKQTILLTHLRPALEDVMKKATEAVAAFDGVTERDAIATAPDPVRKAWSKLEGLSARYNAIRRAHSSLKLQTPARDVLEHFGEFQNAGELWPERHQQYLDRGRASIMHTGGEVKAMQEHQAVKDRREGTASLRAPWPPHEPERLIWIVVNGARPWLPAGEEQDRAFEADLKRRADERAGDRKAFLERNAGIAQAAASSTRA